MRDLPDAVLDEARRAARHAEVYAEELERTQVAFEANHLKLVQSRESAGLALRLIANGRVGFSSLTGEGDPRTVVAGALEVAPFGAEARFTFPGPAETPTVALTDPAVPAMSVEEMVDLAQSVVDGLLRRNPALLCGVSVDRRRYRVRLLNTAGGGAAYEKTLLAVSADANWTRETSQGADILDVWESQSWCSRALGPAAVVESVAHRLGLAPATVPIATGEMPVVFTPAGFAATLIGPLRTALNGKTVLQGASPLGDKLGQPCFDPRLTLTDTPLLDYAPRSRPVDDEGLPSRPTPLIEAGVVRAFLYDLQTAGLAGVASTASASRSVDSLPAPDATALVMAPGDADLDAMLSDVREGLLVDQVMGSWAGNQLSGDFSGNVHLGFKIERGKVVGRVKDSMVAGNVYQALRQLAAVGRERRWVSGGSLLLPHVCIAGLKVSTKA